MILEKLLLGCHIKKGIANFSKPYVLPISIELHLHTTAKFKKVIKLWCILRTIKDVSITSQQPNWITDST
jgi:hypothetical protein